ncbi:MAG: hypothetical protein GKS02_13925 [Alphaproteobacteria bacterium]|nr:hypothetical protein [Alphaproteobacteria bacterium]
MGSWGPGLYSDDTAQELRDLIKTLMRLPKDGEDLLRVILEYVPADDPDDDTYSTVWLVIADQFHRYGITYQPVFDQAREIIEEGLDDALMARLSMSERDRSKRRAQLDDRLLAWSKPPGKIANRRILNSPQRHPVSPGDIWFYPTKDGNPVNTFDPAAYTAEHFHPDGWAAFAIARNEHRLGLFPVSYFIRLHVDAKSKPTLESCRLAPITGMIIKSFGVDPDPRPCAGWAPITSSIIKKIGAQKAGAVELSWSKIEKRLILTDFDPKNEPPALYHGLFVSNKSGPDPEYWDYPVELEARLSDLMV